MIFYITPDSSSSSHNNKSSNNNKNQMPPDLQPILLVAFSKPSLAICNDVARNFNNNSNRSSHPPHQPRMTTTRLPLIEAKENIIVLRVAGMVPLHTKITTDTKNLATPTIGRVAEICRTFSWRGVSSSA